MSPLVSLAYLSFVIVVSAGRCCWSRWGDKTTCSGYPEGAHGGLCNIDYKTKCRGSTCAAPAPGPAPAPHPSPAPPPSPPPPPAPISPAQIHRMPVFNVKVTHDVTYGQGLIGCARTSAPSSCKAVDLKLDVYEPIQKAGGVVLPARRPAYVMMHGGGNVGGSKGGLNIYTARWWASRGFVVFDIDYRLARDRGLVPPGHESSMLGWTPQWASFYPATRDAKASIRFVRANAEKYGIDTERIASTGGSAGATDMFAAGVSFEDDFKNEIAVDPTLKTTNIEFSSAVKALVLHWPSHAGVELLQDHFPAPGPRYRSDNPSVISFHGDNDTTIPIAQSYGIQQAYAKTGAPFELHVLKGCPHASWCYNGKGACQCAGAQRSALMEELAFPVVTQALNLTVVESSASMFV